MGRSNPPHLLISEDLGYLSLRLEIGINGRTHTVELDHRLEIVVAEAGRAQQFSQNGRVDTLRGRISSQSVSSTTYPLQLLSTRPFLFLLFIPDCTVPLPP